MLLYGPWMVYGLVCLYIRLGTICVCGRELLLFAILFCDFTLFVYTVLSELHSSLLSFYPLNVAIDCFIILDKVF